MDMIRTIRRKPWQRAAEPERAGRAPGPSGTALRAFVVAGILCGGSAGCEKSSEEATDAKPSSTTPAGVLRLNPEEITRAGIVSQPVVRGEFRSHKDFPAIVRPNENQLAEVRTLVRGRAVDVYADLGQEVQTGQLLAVLYSSDLGLAQAAYLKTQAKLHEAERAFARARDLLRDGAISLAEFQRREAEMLSARPEAREARDRLEQLGMREQDIQHLKRKQTIRSHVPVQAPIAGRVIFRNLTRGEVVETSEKLFVVADLSTVWVIANIPEKDIPYVHRSAERDRSVEILLSAYPHEAFQGQVTYVGDVLDPDTRTMRLRVTVPNPERRLKPEMFATVRVYSPQKQDILSVPLAAIQRGSAGAMVFIQQNAEQFEARMVRLGEESGEVVAVLQGLREGERVVTKGAFVLKSEAEKHKIEPAQ